MFWKESKDNKSLNCFKSWFKCVYCGRLFISELSLNEHIKFMKDSGDVKHYEAFEEFIK